MAEKRRVWRCCDSYPCICGMNTGNTLPELKPEPAAPAAAAAAQSGQRFYDFCLATGGYEVAASDYHRVTETTDLTGSVQVVFPPSQSSWGVINQAVVVHPGDPITKPIRVVPLQPMHISVGMTLTLQVNFTP